MSEQEQSPEPTPVDQSIECSMCGKTGGPQPACQLCHGNRRFIRQGRHFTLSEERQGLNPNEQARRYGEDGSVGPERIETDIVMPKVR